MKVRDARELKRHARVLVSAFGLVVIQTKFFIMFLIYYTVGLCQWMFTRLYGTASSLSTARSLLLRRRVGLCRLHPFGSSSNRLSFALFPPSCALSDPFLCMMNPIEIKSVLSIRTHVSKNAGLSMWESLALANVVEMNPRVHLSV